MNAFKEEYSLTISQAIQWGDMDAFQHVNNAMYFRYFENVRINYFDATGVNEYMSANKVGPILGSTECKFLAPLTYPENIIIGTKVSAIREKRFTMLYAVYSEEKEKIVAQGSGEIIYFHYGENRSCKIPAEIVSNIKRFEEM